MNPYSTVSLPPQYNDESYFNYALLSHVKFAIEYRAAKQIFEKAYFTQLLEQSGGNISKTARLAQWDRTYLRNKIKELGLYGGEESDNGE